MARLKVLLLSIIAVVTLAAAVPSANAQVHVVIGPRHRRYYHHHHYYYRHGHRYYR